jgi:hypothetical protein
VLAGKALRADQSKGVVTSTGRTWRDRTPPFAVVIGAVPQSERIGRSTCRSTNDGPRGNGLHRCVMSKPKTVLRTFAPGELRGPRRVDLGVENDVRVNRKVRP